MKCYSGLVSSQTRALHVLNLLVGGKKWKTAIFSKIIHFHDHADYLALEIKQFSEALSLFGPFCRAVILA